MNHPTFLSLRHPLVDAGLTAREAQLVQDAMISPKFFGSVPTFWLGMQVCRGVFDVNLWRKTHNFPVLDATRVLAFEDFKVSDTSSPEVLRTIGWDSNEAW